MKGLLKLTEQLTKMDCGPFLSRINSEGSFCPILSLLLFFRHTSRAEPMIGLVMTDKFVYFRRVVAPTELTIEKRADAHKTPFAPAANSTRTRTYVRTYTKLVRVVGAAMALHAICRGDR